MNSMGIITLLGIIALSTADEMPLNPMRAAKCVIPNEIEQTAQADFFQECLSKNYAQGDETQCYKELGCFPMDDPWTTLLRPLPSPMHPAEIHVMLQCYTRAKLSKMYNIKLWPDVFLNGCPFDGKKRTVFITHGFASTGNFSWLPEFKDRYLKQVDANIFIVDWGKGAQLLNYLQVASNTRIVGAEVARFIKFLQNKFGLSVKNIHLIGHSLGAQISSYIAKRIAGIDRLTALDPAQPGFEGTDSRVRLDKTDAKFVEVIHTNAAPFIPSMGFGMIAPHGHVDFYINGGMHQPGCQVPATQPKIKDIKDLANYSVDVIIQWVCCSHCRAFEFYMRVLQENCIIWGRKATITESLMNAGSLGLTETLFSKTTKCTPETCIPLFLDTPRYKARGVFAAITNIKEPFCETNPEVNRKMLADVTEDPNQTRTKIRMQQIIPPLFKTAFRAGEAKIGGVLDKTKDILTKTKKPTLGFPNIEL